jgi:hypothetical protein
MRGLDDHVNPFAVQKQRNQDEVPECSDPNREPGGWDTVLRDIWVCVELMILSRADEEVRILGIVSQERMDHLPGMYVDTGALAIQGVCKYCDAHIDGAVIIPRSDCSR